MVQVQKRRLQVVSITGHKQDLVRSSRTREPRMNRTDREGNAEGQEGRTEGLIVKIVENPIIVLYTTDLPGKNEADWRGIGLTNPTTRKCTPPNTS